MMSTTSEMSSLSRPVLAVDLHRARQSSLSSTESSGSPYDGSKASPATPASPSYPSAQAPVLTYHDSPSGSSVSTVANAVDCIELHQPLRKRFKAPIRSHVFDRASGNHKPWMNGRTTITRDKASYFVCLFGILAGVALGLYSIISDALHVDHDQWCPVLEDDFAGNTLNQSLWKVEQRIGGGESNDFTWFTGHNSYVADGNLFIVPTLTNETMLPTDYAVMNSTYMQLGSVCDSLHQSDCFIAADVENNQTLVVPPVQSAMISTRNTVTINEGRVVVRARMPTGDWLWPQFSLVPQDEAYGAYPASGLMTIFESRGNKAQHRLDQLNNEMICGLHWGPANAPSYDRFHLTQGLYKVYRSFFNERHYEFGLDWNQHSITMWVNSRVRIAFRYGFGSKTFWNLGDFGYSYGNGTIIGNPWQNADNKHMAPFDQPMYLRIAVLAGGTDGYWQDDLPNKPWRNSDGRLQAMQRFWDWAGVWQPTWPSGDRIRERGLAVESVKMYQRPTHSYEGDAFLAADVWQWWGNRDNLTNGAVYYVKQEESSDLAYVNDAGRVVLKVDDTITLPSGGLRNSIRITTREAYDIGSLFVFDAVHLPYGCATWPAFWAHAASWPSGGEIDMFEGVNLQTTNQVALHTVAGCYANTTTSATGDLSFGNCDYTVQANRGCTYVDQRNASYGAAFAAGGGGVFAGQLASEGISVWFFPRNEVPADLAANSSSPDPTGWGLPMAYYPKESCDINQFFAPQQITINIALCGNWAGEPGVFSPSCGSGSCADYILDPSTMRDAYFEINSLRIYSDPDRNTRASSRSVAAASGIVGDLGATQVPTNGGGGRSWRGLFGAGVAIAALALLL
ncbi:hypothetical protein JCM10207_009109 [Rhodosporidiobolus poonsookiae]